MAVWESLSKLNVEQQKGNVDAYETKTDDKDDNFKHLFSSVTPKKT